MSTVYIDPSATYNGDGTTGDPATSPGGVGAKNAWPSLVDGTEYLQKRGTTATTSSRLRITSAGVVSIGAYGDGAKPIIQGNCPASSLGDILICEGGATLTISDIVVKGATGYNRHNIHASGTSSAVKCYRVESYDAIPSDTAVNLFRGQSGGLLTLEDCIGDNSMGDGIFSQNTVNIKRTRISRIGMGETTANGDCIQLSGSAGTLSNSIIKGCYLDRSVSASTNTKQVLIIEDTSATGIVVEDNECIQDGANTAIYIDVATGGASVKRNKVSDATNGIAIASVSGTNGITLDTNIIVDCTNAVYIVAKAGETYSVYGNTIVDCSIGIKTALSVAFTLNDKNNLYYGVTTTLSSAGYSPTITHNTATNWTDADGDPNLDAQYVPCYGSPAIGAGTYISRERDFLRRQRQVPPCIGAMDLATLKIRAY